MIKRPALHMAIAFGTGILTAWYIRQGFFAMVLFLLMLLLYCYGMKKKLLWVRNIFLWAICFICGYLNYALQYTVLPRPVVPCYEAHVKAEGYIVSACTVSDDRTTFEFFTQTMEMGDEQIPIDRKIRINIYGTNENHDFSPGTRLIISGGLEKPSASRNPGGFNSQSWLYAKKIPAVMSVSIDSVQWISPAKNLPLLRFGYGIRQRILSSLEKNLSHEKAALMAAMLTGYRENLTDTMEDAFSAAGLTHIMAVSGANLAFLLMPLLWMFRMLGFHRRAGAIVAVPFIFIYILITGMEASILRAAVMAFVVMAGKALDRNADLLNSIGVASLVLLIVNPFMLFDAGFLLSFGATAGLGLLYKRVLGLVPEKVPKLIRETLAATISAQAGVIPILILYFSKISLISLVANLFVVPLTGVTTVVGMLCVIGDSIYHGLGFIAGCMLQGLLHIILYITGRCASIPWAEVNMQHWSSFGVLIYYLFLILAGTYGLHFFNRHKNKTVISALLLGVVLVAQGIIPPDLKVIFIDVGQGDSVLIRTAGGRNYMIDGGGGFNELKTGYTGRQVLLPLLMSEGITRLDQILVSHAHSDHISGVITLLECFPVESVGMPDYPGNTEDFSALIETCQAKGIELNYYAAGDTLEMDDWTKLNILYPDKENTPGEGNLNNTSLVGMLCYRQLQMLFTGDIETKGEAIFLDINSPMDCDILKVAHHGGRNATSEAFLVVTNPEVAVISVGKNSFGHPTEEVLSRLSDNGVNVYTTLEHGAVIVNSDGNKYRIRPWLRDEQFTFLN